MAYTLPDLELLKIKVEGDSKDLQSQKIILEPLSPGYGVTIGNSLRRILLSSLEGSAVSAVKIDGATHEFTTLPGMKEDVVELILNLKALPVKLLSSDSVILKLNKKSIGEVKASDFAKNPDVEIIDPEYHLASLDKNGKLNMEVTVERGRGFVPTEKKTDRQVPLGTILVDSIFTPIKKVHYEVENTRVGGATNYDKLTLDITTDGSVAPLEAVKTGSRILMEHLAVLTETAGQTLPRLTKTQPKKIAKKPARKNPRVGKKVASSQRKKK